jgi:hypothetical protein
VGEPYINAVVNLNVPFGDFENETIHYNYIFVKYPQKSDLIPPPLKHFLESRAIHSVLYVPLRVSGVAKYFLTFDSQDQHEGFSKAEIEILTFLGIEILSIATYILAGFKRTDARSIESFLLEDLESFANPKK